MIFYHKVTDNAAQSSWSLDMPFAELLKYESRFFAALIDCYKGKGFAANVDAELIKIPLGHVVPQFIISFGVDCNKSGVFYSADPSEYRVYIHDGAIGIIPRKDMKPPFALKVGFYGIHVADPTVATGAYRDAQKVNRLSFANNGGIDIDPKAIRNVYNYHFTNKQNLDDIEKANRTMVEQYCWNFVKRQRELQANFDVLGVKLEAAHRHNTKYINEEVRSAFDKHKERMKGEYHEKFMELVKKRKRYDEDFAELQKRKDMFDHTKVEDEAALRKMREDGDIERRGWVTQLMDVEKRVKALKKEEAVYQQHLLYLHKMLGGEDMDKKNLNERLDAITLLEMKKEEERKKRDELTNKKMEEMMLNMQALQGFSQISSQIKNSKQIKQTNRQPLENVTKRSFNDSDSINKSEEVGDFVYEQEKYEPGMGTHTTEILKKPPQNPLKKAHKTVIQEERKSFEYQSKRRDYEDEDEDEGDDDYRYNDDKSSSHSSSSNHSSSSSHSD